MNDLCALILAGGSGRRFWPKSTPERPKQFLNLIGEKTMLQLTVDRINKKIDMNNIFIVVSPQHKSLVHEQINNINEENIIIQPEVKNTAPCIMMSINYIKQLRGNVNIIVLPSDHFITKEDTFLNNIEIANTYVNEDPTGIITFGIVPSRPETGYGYIRLVDDMRMDIVNPIDKFVEKPSIDDALAYLQAGNYLWNAGVFLFNIESMIELFKKYLNNTYQLIIELPSITDSKYNDYLIKKYSKCNNISFDYAIMEKCNQAYVIPSNIGWDDVGTWQSLERYCAKDENGNIAKGIVEFYESKDNIVYGDKKKIILSGLDNIVCIDTDNVIVISNKSQIDRIHILK